MSSTSTTTTTQLLDALTSHAALFSPPNPNPNPNPRSAILRWFSTLPSTLRRSHLTFHHPTLLSLLHTITSRSPSSLFLLLPDLPNGPLPSLCFRRPTSLLARVSASKTSIGDQILLFESGGGMLDCVTVREGFVEDVEGFVEVMDGVSNGGFLRGEVEGLGEEWCELPWLKEKGFYSLDAFLGNWIEVALRRAWLERKRKGVKGNVLAKNVLERKIGCVDWFLRLDSGVRRRVCVEFLTKGAKLMVTELLKSPDFASMDEIFSCKEPSGGAHCKTRNQLLHGTDLDFFLCAIQKKAPGKNSILLRHLKKLVVLQQIGNILFACQNGEINPDSIFFTTLSSVHTIQDYVFRRLRGFLKVIANSSMEFELMMDLSTNSLTKNPDVKSKKKNRKGAKTMKKSSKSPQECSNIHQQQNDSNDTSLCQRQGPAEEIESGISHINPICEESCLIPSSNNSLSSSQKEVVAVIANEKVKPDHIVELAEHRTRIPRKRSGRKRVRGKMKVVDKIENPTTSTQGSNCVVSIEWKEENELSNSDSPVPLKSTDDKVKIDISTSGLASVDDEPKEVLADFSAPSTLCECQNGHTFARFDVEKPSDNKNVSIEKNEGFQNQMKTSGSLLSNDSSVDIAQDKTIATSASLESVSYGNRYCCAEETDRKSKSFEVENGCQPADAVEYRRGVLNGSNTVYEQGYNSSHFGTQTTYVGSTSYEWPDLTPQHSLHFRSTNPPAATDRLHLEVGHNLPKHYHHSFLTTRHQVRHAPVEHGHGHTLTAVNFPLSSDLPPLVRNCSRLIQSVTPNIEPWNPRIRSTLCTGSPNEGVQFKGAYMENEWLYSGDVVDLSDYQNGSYFFDDTDSHWMSEEELDVPINGRDYNKYFGGGAMYWNTPEHVGMGSSRAPSHSSEDSSWAWHEADLNRAIDDMVGLPGIPATYGVNGLASPTTPALCSPFETLGHGQQSIGYVFSGNDMNSKSIDSQTSTADIPEDDATPGSLNASTGSIDGMKGDSLPYPMLRPIIIPSISRKGSRSDFKHSRDHRSPCLPSSKKDAPRIKRPPSPVVLCIPRAPRVPPPSPVGDSRKLRGFPVVRSGSSSPRHWGMRSGHHEETKSDDANLCIDGPEVVWTSWGSKGIPRNAMVQAVPGSLLQERLIAISQIGRDQEHPDVAFPVQPPEKLKHPTWKTSLTSGCSLLHEEISSFCKQVAAENHSKKPYINWAVKRVARSLQVLWPRSRTNIFGSVATGLALPSSDVDLVVCLPPVRNLEPIKEAGILEGRNGIKETCLQHASRYLANQEWVKNDSLKTIENTAIPLIMLVAEVPIYLASSNGRSSSSHLQERQSTESVGTCGISHSSLFNAENASSVLSSAEVYKEPVRLDISFKSPSHTGLQTTELVRELTEQFPASVPLALILKQFLADRSLDHAYSGGLSSYCLVLLITRFLQHEHHIGRLLNQNLGSLLMDFLYFFGNVFDPRQMRISIRGSGLYMNRERGYSIDPIHIDDPLCATNNVGRNCFRIHQCIKAFADAYSLLESEMVSFSSNQDSQTSSSAKLLEKIIPSIYEKKPS